jgi:hypothetical protein
MENNKKTFVTLCTEDNMIYLCEYDNYSLRVIDKRIGLVDDEADMRKEAKDFLHQKTTHNNGKWLHYYGTPIEALYHIKEKEYFNKIMDRMEKGENLLG